MRRLRLARRHKPKILGCHFSLFREDIEKVNGFDENFVGWGMEDDDFALRLHQAGLDAKSVILTARAMHLWHPATASKPAALRDTPNADYFHRAHVDTRCRKGLLDSD
ncbi:MAG: hypothetical protein LC725_08795 [Lentisphaerae bacterium]|nr:hypothetical protein [Lentisphaerota bacterium]